MYSWQGKNVNNISVLIITRNEEDNIRQCLDTVSWASEIIVVDSHSSDSTVRICREYTDKVFDNKFIDFSAQKNYALSKSSNDWVLFVDADERITSELKEEISALNSKNFNGYYIPRKNIIFGRYMKYGGHQNDLQLRLFIKSRSHFKNPVHEKVVVEGSMGYLNNYIEHYSTESLSEYCKKMNSYTDMEAKRMSGEKIRFSVFRMMMKTVGKFLYQYIIQEGFRDGKEGLIYYSLSSFYVFLKHIKLWEICQKQSA